MNKDWLTTTITWLVATALSHWARLTETVHILLLLMLLDWATGIVSSGLKGKISSSVGWLGVGKKALTLVLIATVHLASKTLHLGIDLGEVVALFYAVNEFVSIIENCHRAGVPVPPQLVLILAKLRVAEAKKDVAEATTAVEKERQTKRDASEAAGK